MSYTRFFTLPLMVAVSVRYCGFAEAPTLSLAPTPSDATPSTSDPLAFLDNPYRDDITYAAAVYQIHPRLIHAVIQAESGYNPWAVSPKGARGLMQLMPNTARRLGVSNVFDARENILAGTHYLRSLLDRFEGDVTLALAAYNAGEHAVLRYGGIPPYAETHRYLASISRILKE